MKRRRPKQSSAGGERQFCQLLSRHFFVQRLPKTQKVSVFADDENEKRFAQISSTHIFESFKAARTMS
jgi:hypothetical protein